MTLDLQHLDDHIELISTVLRLRLQGCEDERIATQLTALQTRIAMRPSADLAAPFIAERLELSESEMMVVWTLASLAVSADVRNLFSQVTNESEPTLRGLRSVVYGDAPSAAAVSELSERGVLRRLGVVESCTLSPLVLDLLHGQIPDTSFIPTAIADLAVDPTVIAELRHAISAGNVVVVAGLPSSGRRTVLDAVAGELGMQTKSIDTRTLTSIERLRAVALECRLSLRLPVLTNLDAIDEERRVAIGRELVAQLDGPVLATCGLNRPAIRWDRPAVFVELARPSTQQLAALWQRELGQGTDEEADALATRYPLAPALIHHAAKAAKARAAGADLSGDDITAGIRAVLDDRLGQFARRVTVTQSWNDIVLPLDQLEAVSELVSRVRGRRKVIEDWGFGAKVGKGLGVTALFSGPPGTGKTMLASLIAQELGLEMYQVDLGKIVSKWIGETEKNLGALFDAAEAGHAVLLFDEADALFGKRTEVKSSNDRHANLETNYLLQRLESYTGVCLLTTNHDSHIDPAFQRRLSLHLRIELPDVDERAELWRAMLPTAAPVADDLDFGSLARRYVMSGGYIRNAVLRAAFVAADKSRPITQEALERAARREFEGMGKIVVAA